MGVSAIVPPNPPMIVIAISQYVQTRYADKVSAILKKTIHIYAFVMMVPCKKTSHVRRVHVEMN